ncbi:MAG: membrane protein insertase YidC [Robiginitomaculum sp.]|nr:membrane protein insertase YidC [Robiginitomaculum sp.]MDQ7076809.1 membrane protein insertase YidC [Robiginitomaculum sp.]
MGEQRNLFLAIALALGVLLIYQTLVIDPAAKRQRAAREAAAKVQMQSTPAAPRTNEVDAAPVVLNREAALRAHPRVRIATPSVDGSINLDGARFDDLLLRKFRVDMDPNSAEVVLLDPRKSRGGYFSNFSWRAADEGANSTLPGLNTRWTLIKGEVLTPQTPITLQYRSPEGLVFERTISVDAQYMFTIADTVRNEGETTRTLAPAGVVRRYGDPTFMPKNASREEKMKNRSGFILHQGAIGVVGDKVVELKYRKLAKDGGAKNTGTGGWLGFTDKYWLAVMIPPQDEQIDAEVRTFKGSAGDTVFEASYRLEAETIAPGQSVSVEQKFFAGAKQYKVLQAYQENQGVTRFDMAIDWGIFWFLTRPYFNALDFFYGLVGNFGIAILLLTLAIKIIFFPIANRSYASMARMKALQPKMEELRAKFKDDPQRMQMETMELYKREKVNPVGGCLPMLLQIPIFYALYKTLYISIEMRHAPFFGWIKDLSAPDPTHIGNLFGLLPWDPTGVPVFGAILAVGIWPLIMGLTMGAQQLLNPPAPDPMQRRIFAFMPVIFTIMLAPFAAGLVIYWAWNNFLSLIQQYVITRKNGVETPFDKVLAKLKRKMSKNDKGAAS